MLPCSKTGAKIVYLNRQVLAALVGMPNRAETGLVLPWVRGDKPIGLSAVWCRTRQHAAVPDVRLHDLRHTFTSHVAARSETLPMIGKLLGHTK